MLLIFPELNVTKIDSIHDNMMELDLLPTPYYSIYDTSDLVDYNQLILDYGRKFSF